ncbi:MAG: DUF3419 family protein [Fimbriimonadaceae bacterium]|nr:DUF3419 family protein [Chitinophagales bacterium]
MSKKEFLHKAELDIIRYANCWEDADNLLEGLQCQAGNKIVSIASAGDNCFALLITNPELLVAVDVSAEQLYLTELKKTAIQYLEYEDFLKFIGVMPDKERIKIFHGIKHALSKDAQQFWETRMELIESGIIFQGKFEKYFLKFRKYILPFIHTQKRVEKLLSEKTREAQIQFYNTRWNTTRWRFLFKIFFSRYVMGKFGRDPEFLKQVDISVGDFIFSKAEQHLKDEDCQKNYFLRKIFMGNFGKELPVYLRKENYPLIKHNIHRMKLHKGYLQDVFSAFGKFHHINASNIFEYMPQHVFEEVGNSLYSGCEKDGTIAYWNLMVARKLSNTFPKKFCYDQISRKLYERDYGFFYRDFICEEII